MNHVHKLFFRTLFFLIFLALGAGIIGAIFIRLSPIKPSQQEKIGSDLSYILVVSPENSDVKLVNQQSEEVSAPFIQQPIVDPVSGKSSGPGLKEINYAQPDSGIYYLIFSSHDEGGNVYLYDRNGNSINSPIKSGEYEIKFDKDNLQESTISLQ